MKRNDVIFRRARQDELDRVRAAYLDWGYGGGAQPDDLIFVAERNGELIGIVRRTEEHGLTMLRGMWIRPSDRRQGIGSALLAAFVDELEDGACWCVPYVHLITFYGQVGFEVSPEEGAPEFIQQRLARYRMEGHDVTFMRRPGH